MMIIWAKSWQNEAVTAKETGLGERKGEGGKKGDRVGQPELQERKRL